MPRPSRESSPAPRGAESSSSTSSCPTPGRARRSCEIQACGVCHTDLHYREGGINDEFPFLLGHEAAGVVEAVGDGVTDVAPGDFVILNWRAVCGQCRACAKGKPWYCFNTHNATQKMTLTDGTELIAGPRHRRVHREDAGGRRPVHQGRPRGRRGRRGRPARVRRHGRLRRGRQHRRGRPGRLRGRHRLRRRRQRRHRRRRAWPARRRSSPSTSTTAKLERAKQLRRHAHRQQHGRRPGRGDPRRSPAATAPTSSIEAVGRPETYEQAFYARDLAGTVVLVGVPTPDMTVDAAADRRSSAAAAR